MPLIIKPSDAGGSAKQPNQSAQKKPQRQPIRERIPDRVKIAALAVIIVAALAFVGAWLFGGRGGQNRVSGVGYRVSDQNRHPTPSAQRPTPNARYSGATATSATVPDANQPSREETEDQGEGIH